MALFEVSMPLPRSKADNKQIVLTVPRLHRTLTFCTRLRGIVELFGSFVLEKHCFGHEFGFDEEKRKFL